MDAAGVRVKIGGLTVNTLRYADETTLLVENEDLKDLRFDSETNERK